jgi:hypothetical protein
LQAPSNYSYSWEFDSGMRLAAESRHGGSSPVTPVDDQTRTPRRQGVGPRSKLTLHEPWIESWLREDPDLSGAELLRRVRLIGYRGGKSAFYELVRRLRATATPRPERAPGRRQG